MKYFKVKFERKIMKGGITYPLGLMVVAIGIIIFILLLNMSLPQVRASIQELLGKIGISLPKKLTDFEKAIQCAYYRCKYGCESERLDFDFFGHNCYEFCLNIPEEFREKNYRICGWNAKQFPIEVEVKDGDNVSLDTLTLPGCANIQTCLIPIEVLDGVSESSYPCSIKFGNKLLKRIINGKKCEVGYRSWLPECNGKKVDCGASEIEVKKGDYYIWTHKEVAGPTIVWSDYFYIFRKLNEPMKSEEIGKEKFYRIKLKDEKERNVVLNITIPKCPPLEQACIECFSCIESMCAGTYKACTDCLKSKNCPTSPECDECMNFGECEVPGFSSCFVDPTSAECEYYISTTGCDICTNCFSYAPYIATTVKYGTKVWNEKVLEIGDIMDVEIKPNYHLTLEVNKIYDERAELGVRYLYFVK
jgi:hypothetical protein